MLAVAALGAALAGALLATSADEPVRGTADPLDVYTATAMDQQATSIFENMPDGTFDHASVVVVSRDEEKVGVLTTLTLTGSARMRLTMGDMNLDTFLKDAIQSDSGFGGQLSEDAIDMPIIGSTRVAAVYPWGSLFAVWVQDGNLMALTCNPFDARFDRASADKFLQDYLGTSPEFPVAE